MSIERIIKHLRDIRILMKKKFFDKEIRFKIEHSYQNFINLESDSENESEQEEPNKVVE